MNTNSFKAHKKGGKGRDAYERWRNGRPEREATEALIVSVTKNDKSRGIPGSFTKCAYARALKRQGFTDVFVLRTISYVGMIYNGYSAVIRFENSSGTKEFIRRYDRSEPVDDIRQLTLLPVPPSRTKEYDRKKSACRAERIKNEGGKIHTKLTTRKERRPLAPNEFEFVRDGRGFHSSSHGSAHH